MKSLGGNRISILDFLFILCLVIYGGNASIFTREFGNIMNLSTYVPLVLAFLVGIKYKIRFDNTFRICLIVFFIYWLLASVVNSYFSLGLISHWLVILIICYICCKCYGIKYIDYFETIVFYLTIISMLFWFAYLVAPDLVTNFCERFRWGESFSDHTEVINIGVYTILDIDFTKGDYHLFYRNSGFAWEPGAFATILCFAIACNIFRKGGLIFVGNFPLYLYLIALFSTESTTGGITFILIIIFWMLTERKSWKSLFYLIIALPLFVWVFNQDFVGTKFIDEYNSALEVTNSSNAVQNEGGTPRLISFILYFQEFLNKPIFGLAGNPNTLLKSQGFHASLHSGIGHLLAEFGIIMSILFFRLCFRTNNCINKITNKNYFVILVALFGQMVSFRMWESPVFFTFVILGWFLDTSYSNKAVIET